MTFKIVAILLEKDEISGTTYHEESRLLY